MAIEDIVTKKDLERLIDKRIEQTPMVKIQGLTNALASIVDRLKKGGL